MLSLKEISKKYKLSLFDTDDYYLTNSAIIIKIFNSKLIKQKYYHSTNPIILNIIGLYYQYVKLNYNKAICFYKRSIAKNDSYAMISLGCYYQFIEKDYTLMKQYYLMAIQLNDSRAMCNLGYYYQTIENNYQMKKFYLMSIQLNNSDAMYNLGYYYQDVGKDYELMKVYYLMAITQDNTAAMNNLKLYCKTNIALYKELCLIANPSNLIINKITELKTDPDIQIYNTKILTAKINSHYKCCSLCLEDKVLNIKLNCLHDICINCYEPNMNCYYKFCHK